MAGLVAQLLTREGCGPCVATKASLRRAGASFTEVDVESGDAAPLVERAKVFGHTALPVVFVYDTATGEVVDSWAGFRPDALKVLTGGNG